MLISSLRFSQSHCKVSTWLVPCAHVYLIVLFEAISEHGLWLRNHKLCANEFEICTVCCNSVQPSLSIGYSLPRFLESLWWDALGYFHRACFSWKLSSRSYHRTNDLCVLSCTEVPSSRRPTSTLNAEEGALQLGNWWNNWSQLIGEVIVSSYDERWYFVRSGVSELSSLVD